MISIGVYKQGNFPVNSKKIKDVLRKVLVKEGIVSSSDVSVAIVGDKKMKDISKEYLLDSDDHSVLAFPASETKKPFVFPPDNKLYLGEIVISFPEATREANNQGKLIDEVVSELVEHATYHLLGIHNE